MPRIPRSRLQRERMARFFTAREIADTVKIDVSAMSCFEGVTRVPSLLMAFRLAKLYGCTVDELFREHAAKFDPEWFGSEQDQDQAPASGQ